MLYDTLIDRRSIREFLQTPVEDEKVRRLLDAALLSPSSRNIRPWELVLVDDPTILKRLARCKMHGAEFLDGAPMAVVVAADTRKSDVWVEDASIVSCVLLLMAHELGLGACWCQVRKRRRDGQNSAADVVRQTLSMPDYIDVESIIGIGYAAEKKPPYDEGSLLRDKIHHNLFCREG